MRDGRGRLLLGAMLGALACADPGTTPDPDPPPVDSGFALHIVGGASRTAALTEVLGLVIEVERHLGGYEGPIAFSADAPPGIVVIFRPTFVLNSNSTDVLLVAEASVAPGLHQVRIRGSAPDRPDQVVTLALTLTPQP